MLLTDLLHTFSPLDRNLNFIEHTSKLGWKAWAFSSLFLSFSSYDGEVSRYLNLFCRNKRAMPLMIDPGLYKTTKSDVFWVNPTRALPTAFKLFTGLWWENWSSILIYWTHLKTETYQTNFWPFSFTRIGMDGSVTFICGVPHLGLGQPS